MWIVPWSRTPPVPVRRFEVIFREAKGEDFVNTYEPSHRHQSPLEGRHRLRSARSVTLPPCLRPILLASLVALSGLVFSSTWSASPPSLVQIEIDANDKCHFAEEVRTCQDLGRYLRDMQHVSLRSPIGISIADATHADAVQAAIESLLNAGYMDVRLLPANRPQATTPN